jgi:hypothetical protein
MELFYTSFNCHSHSTDTLDVASPPSNPSQISASPYPTRFLHTLLKKFLISTLECSTAELQDLSTTIDRKGVYMFKNGARCLRHCAKRRKVAGSIPDGVIGILN